MSYGFFRVACASPQVTVADCKKNAENIVAAIKKASDDCAAMIVLPELSITGYTCGDLFLQTALINAALDSLIDIIEATASLPIVSFVGLPFSLGNKLYNCAAVIQRGHLLALIPKSNIPNYREFYELRYFTAFGSDSSLPFAVKKIHIRGMQEPVFFGTNILFSDAAEPSLAVAAEICEDLWVPCPPSIRHAIAGATVIANLSASNEVIGKSSYRRMLVQSQSARLAAAYVYADAGCGESTTDMIFAAHNLIAENGTILAESEMYTDGYIVRDLDIERLVQERLHQNTFSTSSFFNNTDVNWAGAVSPKDSTESYTKVHTVFTRRYPGLKREIQRFPFVPITENERDARCSEITTMQAAGLAKRLAHTGCKNAVVGLSGGLDSTLALLVTIQAFKKCNLKMNGIIAVTMPCFGTTDRTYNNACQLAKEAGVTLKEIKIENAVRQHFSDIGHDENKRDVTYENSQARERTQVLMDIANQCGGLVIGTGDLSELALGWSTYNGDHMSMYGVNASIPKTLVRYLVAWFAKENKKLKSILTDILDTPVSPELLPAENGVIAQKTEELVGPYELHDFFLYYMLRWGFSPRKIRYLAEQTFCKPTKKNLPNITETVEINIDDFDFGTSDNQDDNGKTESLEKEDGYYTKETIDKWLNVFYKRFFSQQFKRSCLPDGAKVGTVSLSPRGDWRMPSDASAAIWLEELNDNKNL